MSTHGADAPVVQNPLLAATLDTVDRVARGCARHWIIAVTAIGVVVYLPFLAERVLHVEEGRRAFQALAILDGGSLWLLEVGGERYVRKPPLLPWLIALASFVTGGVNEWSVRLPGAVFTVIAALCAGGIARLLLADRANDQRDLAAFAAGIAFVCCPSIIERARLGETDTLVTGGVALAFLAFAAGRSRPQPPLWSWLGVAAGLAAAALAKGPIPLCFAIIPIMVTAATERPRSQLLFAVAAIVLALMPLAAWAYLNLQGRELDIWFGESRVAGISLIEKREFLLQLLYLNQVPRWILGTMPWVLFGGGYLWYRRHDVLRPGLLRAVMLYAVPMSLVVLLAPYGRGRYALPAIVPMAALAGVAIAVFWERPRVRGAFAACAMLFVPGAMIAAVYGGRTVGQYQLRANVADLVTILEARPAGRLLAIHPNLELLSYGRRPLRIVTAAAIRCPLALDTLIAPRDLDVVHGSNGAWTLIGPIGTSPYDAYAAGDAPGACPS